MQKYLPLFTSMVHIGVPWIFLKALEAESKFLLRDLLDMLDKLLYNINQAWKVEF